MNPKLDISVRTETGKKLKGIREKGLVPGIVYGYGTDNVMISVLEDSFNKIFKSAGENALIDLNIEGQKPRTVLIQDIDKDPVKRNIVHVDFFQVNLTEKVKADVPLVFVGESPAVKGMNGTLLTPLQSIEVESLPAKIPQEIEVDISVLATFEDQIRVKDLRVPADATVLIDPDEAVAMVSAPRTEKEVEELSEEVEGDVSAVEGVSKEGDEPTAEAEGSKEASSRQGGAEAGKKEPKEKSSE